MAKKFLFPLVAVTLLSVTSCGGGNSSNVVSSSEPTSSSENSVVSSEYTPDFTKKVNVRMSVHYQDDKTHLTFGKSKDHTNYTDPAGNTYQTGDLKPAWKALSNRLNFTIQDVVGDKTKVDESYAALKNDTNGSFSGADIFCGKASSIAEDGVAGNYFVNLLDHLDQMPNFNRFLNENPIVKLTITSNAYQEDASAQTKPAIYYAPYFDGYNDIERMTLVRVDWVEKLLDKASTYDTATTIESSFTPFGNDAARSVEVAANLKGSSKKTITKKATENIISRMNKLETKNGSTLVNCLKEYITEAYGTQYSKLSDLYCGVDAAYDADELVALFRCVKANPQLLAGTDSVVPFYPRAYTNDRLADIYRFAGNLFGVRGLESRSNYFYIDKEGKLQDARGDLAVAKVIEKLNQMYSEGLILKDFDLKGTSAKGNWNDDYLKNGTAFATYDYQQTQCAYNEKVDRTKAATKDFDFEPIMGAVADLDDGITNNYIHFTESWRSVKTEGWGITTAAKGDVLDRALAIVDYFYSDAGNMLMSYGPEEYGYIAKDENGNIKTIEYNGKKVPQLSEGMLTQFKGALGEWNYTNYYRYWVGSTYPVGYVKEQGMEYQCSTEQGKNGLEKINANIVAETLKHPTVDNFVDENNNQFYSLVPTTFRMTKSDVDTAKTYTGLGNITSEKNKPNVWHDYVKYGFGGKKGDDTLLATPDALIEQMKDWKVVEFENIYNNCYQTMINNY